MARRNSSTRSGTSSTSWSARRRVGRAGAGPRPDPARPSRRRRRRPGATGRPRRPTPTATGETPVEGLVGATAEPAAARRAAAVTAGGPRSGRAPTAGLGRRTLVPGRRPRPSGQADEGRAPAVGAGGRGATASSTARPSSRQRPVATHRRGHDALRTSVAIHQAPDRSRAPPRRPGSRDRSASRTAPAAGDGRPPTPAPGTPAGRAP